MNEDVCFEKDLIVGVPAQDARAVFQAIASHLAEQTGMDPRVIFTELMNREALGPTGFGSGFALPHALVPNLLTPAKVLVTLRSAIEFNAPDEERVDVFLAIIWPEEQQEGFLPALAKQCRFFRSKKVADGVAPCAIRNRGLDRSSGPCRQERAPGGSCRQNGGQPAPFVRPHGDSTSPLDWWHGCRSR